MRILTIAALFVGLISTTSCYHQASLAYSSSDDYAYDAPRVEDVAGDNNSYEANTDRKIIMDAEVHLDITNTDSTVNEIINLALAYEGYVVSSSNTKTIIRINSDYFKTCLDKIKLLGEVTAQNITGQDVTEQHYDLNLRLENAMNARDRYSKMLAETSDLNEALRLERELERLNNTIDTIKGKLERLEHLDQYATMTIFHIEQEVEEQLKPGVLSYVGIGIYKGVRWLFVRN